MKSALLAIALAASVLADAQGGGCAGNEPIAMAIMAASSPARICQGGEVFFDGTASTPGSGTSILEYKWDFGDGILDSIAGAQTAHTYPMGGQYLPKLIVTSDSGCVSINEVDLIVQVSTTPDFTGTTQGATICLGDSLEMVAVVTPTTWSPDQNVDFGNGLLLPDNPSLAVVSTVHVESASEQEVILGENDIPLVCMDLEHSFMGDLVIELRCPNDQQVFLHVQGGGSTWLGEPIDNTTPGQIGNCWEYCWSATATNGTWADNFSFAESLASGTYESNESLDSLLGCPINGDWTLVIVDLWAQDDGYLCSWTLDFQADPFTPDLGFDSDSCGWAGPGLVSSLCGPLTCVASPVAPGGSNYTFSITDNFGCTYDTTITFFVPDLQLIALNGPSSIPFAGEVTYTVEPTLPDVEAIVWGPLPNGWSWSMDDLDTTDGTAVLLAPTGGAYYICARASAEGCIGDSVCVNVGVGMDAEVSAPDDLLHLAPNPTDGPFWLTRVRTDPPIAVEILDPLGRVLLREAMNGSRLLLDLSNFTNGAYHLRWMDANTIRRQPFVIAR